jgi:hypothetical protein
MRGPWRIKAFLDHSGHAAINTYFTVRPKRDGPPIEFFWAILNSPLANAYAYCNTMQKHIYDGLIAALPLPMRWETHVRPIVDAATSYLEAVKPPDGFALQADDNTVAREALLSMDAAVMRAYGLPVRFERAVLDLFRLPPLRKAARRRKGVGCVFGDYYPADFKSLVPLYKYISASYRSSIVDTVARRIKPSESSVGTAALRAAARAFGGEE